MTEQQHMIEHVKGLDDERLGKLREWLEEGSGHTQRSADHYSFLPEDLVESLSFRQHSAFDVLSRTGELVALSEWTAADDYHDVMGQAWLKAIAERHFDDEKERDEFLSNVVTFALRVVDEEVVGAYNINRLREAVIRTTDRERLTELSKESVEEIKETAEKIGGGSGFLANGKSYTDESDREAYIEDTIENQLWYHNVWFDILDSFDEVEGLQYEKTDEDWVVDLTLGEDLYLIHARAGFATGILYQYPYGDNSAYIRTPWRTHHCALAYMDGVNNLDALARFNRLVGGEGHSMVGRGFAASACGANAITALATAGVFSVDEEE